MFLFGQRGRYEGSKASYDTHRSGIKTFVGVGVQWLEAVCFHFSVAVDGT